MTAADKQAATNRRVRRVVMASFHGSCKEAIAANIGRRDGVTANLIRGLHPCGVWPGLRKSLAKQSGEFAQFLHTNRCCDGPLRVGPLPHEPMWATFENITRPKFSLASGRSLGKPLARLLNSLTRSTWSRSAGRVAVRTQGGIPGRRTAKLRTLTRRLDKRKQCQWPNKTLHSDRSGPSSRCETCSPLTTKR